MALTNTLHQEGENEDLALLQAILNDHDEYNCIASQVFSNLQRDKLSLLTLAEFDDFSLKETIDSWNLDTFHVKPFIIRGILISGIKKLKDTNESSNNGETDNITCQNNDKGNSNDDNSKHDVITVTSQELNAVQALEQLKAEMQDRYTSFLTIFDKTDKEDEKHEEFQFDFDFDDESEPGTERIDQVLKNVRNSKNSIKTYIENMFDELIDQMNNKKKTLIGYVENEFNKYKSMQIEYKSKLESSLKTINEVQNAYKENCEKQSQNMKDILARSETNCKMINKMVQKFNDNSLEMPKVMWSHKINRIEENVANVVEYIEKHIEAALQEEPAAIGDENNNTNDSLVWFKFTWLGKNLCQATKPITHTIAVMFHAQMLMSCELYFCLQRFDDHDIY